jgi:hypothetical protein
MTARRTIQTLALIGMAGFFGAGVGAFVPVTRLLALRTPPQNAQKIYPLPHHIPRYPGGVSLRFAMVHDVLHERFPRHGTAYYRERNRVVRRALEGKKDLPRERYFALLDDLGVGLEFAGEHDEAIRVLRDKLREQQELGLKGRELYSSYANLGTFLILGPFRQVRPGNADDKETLAEGLDLIRRSIAVNPEAHFGREVWQAVIIEYMMALLDDPRLLLRYDMIGNSLDKAIDPSRQRCYQPDMWGEVRANQEAKRYLSGEMQFAPENEAELREQTTTHLRSAMTQVGAEEKWSFAVKTKHQEPVPFDEPTLGIIGMWRRGGGAHPHFALALGETMLRVGQRYIAWCAYERAARLAGIVWPDAELQQKFAAHCRERQRLIEEQLPQQERDRLRPAFEADLDRGQRYQQAYQRYEEQRIAAGASIDDPHFYDAFYATHEAIASPVGSEDQFVVEDNRLIPHFNAAPMLLFAGLFALTFGLVLWLWPIKE